MKALMNIYIKPIPHRMSLRSLRSQHGQAIAGGAAIGVFLMTLTVGLVFFVVNVGVAGYYKERLGFITQQAANFAASLPNNSDLTGPTQELIQQLSAQCGLKGDTTSEVESVTVNGQSAVKVSARSAGLPLVGTMFGLIDTTGNATALRAVNAQNPSGYLAIRARTGGSVGMAYVPITMVSPYATPWVDGHQDVHYPSQVTPPGYSPQTTYSINGWTNAVGQPSGHVGAYSPAAP